MKLNMLVGSLVLGASLCTPSFAGGLLDRMLGLKGSGCDSTCCDTGCAADPSCGCESACAADPSCGCESPCGGRLGLLGGGCGAAPSCGCESACGSGCGAGPSCGIESCGPSCGVETACCKPRRKPLLELLCAAKHKKDHLLARLHANKCCDTGCEPTCGVDPSCGCESACSDPCAGACGAAPSCGCEIASCDSGCGCGPKKLGLLSKLFKHRGKLCCDSACDACGVTSSCGGGCSSCGGAAAPAASAAPMPPAPVVDPSAYLQSNRRVIQATSYVR